MRYLCYWYGYTTMGTMLFIDYEDDDRYIQRKYMGYSVREAIRKFREDNGLKHKKIKITKYNYIPKNDIL